MRKIYLFTLSYPYGTGEKTFITPELRELTKEYKVTILSGASEEERKDEKNITKVSPDVDVAVFKGRMNIMEKLGYAVLAICSPLFWHELCLLKKNRRKIRQCLYYTLAYLAGAIRIERQVEEMGVLDEDTVFYTYWHNPCTLGLLMAKEKKQGLEVVTRTHGYDLYQERCPGNWQPFKRYMTERINAIFFVSEAGRKYYTDIYVKDSSEEKKLYLARLGVAPKTRKEINWNGDIFELVSCSNMIPLKRVELIVEALSLCSGRKIHWTHFGDGTCRENIENLVKEKLRFPDISYSLSGHVSNEKVMEHYAENPVHCFITTSYSEGGCPVSVQEALSYGIPIIGTAVGGIPECIGENGILLTENPSTLEVSEAIKKMYDASEVELRIMGSNSWKLWQERYDSERNYRDFVELLKKIV